MESISNKDKQIKNAHDRDANYSVDEMMDNLKRRKHKKKSNSQSEKIQGKLITREDGSQVIKVRQKKRRSKQQKKTRSTNNKTKWGIFILISISFIFLIAFTIFIIAKYNGRNFKNLTESNISKLTGAKSTKITQIRITPVSGKAQKVDLTWNNNSFLKNAIFNDIRASIKATSFLSQDWLGESIISATGLIYLQTPQINSTRSSVADLISPYQFKSYRCDNFSLYFGNDSKKSPSVSNALVSLRALANGEHQIVFRHGEIRMRNEPEMNLSSAILTLSKKNTTLNALINAKKSHNGEIRLKGNIPKNIQKPINLDITAKNFPIQELLNQDLGYIIQGRIQSDLGNLYYNYQKPNTKNLKISLPFKSSEINIKGFSFLKTLNKLTKNSIYNHPTFIRSHGTIIKTFDKTTIKNLELINNNLLSIEGDLSVSANGKLEGKLKIGLPQSSFKKAIPYPFSNPINGFYYAKIQLKGNIKQPSDNLLELIKKNPKSTKAPSKETLSEQITPKHIQSVPNEADFEELSR